jgi:hypothetical protein
MLKLSTLAQGYQFGGLDGTGKTLTFAQLGTILSARFNDHQL